MRPIGFGLLALAMLAGPALAQPPQDAPIGASGASLPPLQTDDRDGALADDSGQGGPLRDEDRKLHGMVSLGAGTGGYREGAVAVNGPLGKDGYFALSFDGVQYQGRSHRSDRQAAPAPAPSQ